MTEKEIVKATEALLLDVSKWDWSPLPAELSWDSEDPIACTLTFGAGDDRIGWTFAFELVAAISNNVASGVGDVRFDIDTLDGNYVFMRLTSPHGKCTMRLLLSDVNSFVHAVIAVLGTQRSQDLVRKSLDQLLSAILEG